MADVQVQDATGAQAAAKRHLEGHYGAQRLKSVTFSRAWYQTGSKMDVWEVEGDAVVQNGLFSKAQKHFKYQIHPENGRVIAFEG